MPASTKTVWSIILSLALNGACAAQQNVAFNPEEKSLTDIQSALNSGQLSSESLVNAYLKRIAAIDQSGPTLNSIIAVNPELGAALCAFDAETREQAEIQIKYDGDIRK